MAASLKISANTSEVKKSLLDLGKEIKTIGKSKVSIFNEDDRKFIKTELKQELSLMKQKLIDNRNEISKMVKEQAKMEKGSKNELEQRKKIISAYQQQSKLAQQISKVQEQQKSLGGFGGMGGSAGGSGGIMGMLGKLGGLAGGAALAVGGLALVRGYQASQQYQQGVSNRVRLRGLGQTGEAGVGEEQLAAAGMTQQDFIKRQIQTTSRLGRAGGSAESILQQAKFERAFGLEEGSMMNVSGALRGQFGGKGADTAQAKLQASILASGIEDAIGPYLEEATQLLSDINKNGISNTDEMIQIFAEMTKEGKRTPEQIAEAFKGVDQAVKGSTGEANAFFQTAFARAGIGGGTVGGTRLAMQSGGIFGLNADELANRGYNPELIKNMQGAGMTSGLGNRSGAILNQIKKSGGVTGNISDIKDLNTMTGLSQMSNSLFGTEGLQGFDALQMLEKVQNKQMTGKQFDQKLQEMKEGKDPSVARLTQINNTLEGQTDVLNKINTNLMEALGKSAVKVSNIATEADNALVQGTGTLAGAADQSGALDTGLSATKSLRKNLTGGGLGEKLYDSMFGDFEDDLIKARMNAADRKFKKKGNLPSAGPDSSAPSATQGQSMEDAVAKGMTKAMQAQKAAQINNNNQVNVKIQNGDGSVSNKTHR